MCRAWSTALAGRPGEAGGRASSPPVPSCPPVVPAGRGWLRPAITVTGAAPVPGVSGGPGRLAAARSATAATASKTRASGTFGAIRFFMALLLGYRRRWPQSCFGFWAGVPGTDGAGPAAAGGRLRYARAHRRRLGRPAGPGGPGGPGPGQRLGPHHIGVARVVRQFLRPAALTPDPRRAGTDPLHILTSRHLRRPGTRSPGRRRRPSCAGPAAANTSPATPRAQRIRATAVSG